MKNAPRTIATLVGAAALIFATSAVALAQDATPDQAARQARNQARSGQADQTAQGSEAAHRYGPGNGTGIQGVRPQDGTGNGPTGSTGAGANAKPNGASGKRQAKAEKKARTKAARQARKQAQQQATKDAATAGPRGVGTRTRARELSGAGSDSCAGTRSGSRRRAGGSGGARK